MQDTSEFLTAEEVWEKLKVSKSTFYRIQEEGFFKPIYIGRLPRFTTAQIAEYQAALEKERDSE